MGGGLCLVVELHMTRPKAIVRGEEEEERVAVSSCTGVRRGAGAGAGLRKAAAMQATERKMARKARRTRVSAITWPQSEGRTGVGDIGEKPQKNAREEPV